MEYGKMDSSPGYRWRTRFCGWLGVALICLMTGSCSRRTAADVQLLYKGDVEQARAKASSIIFVPGYLGTVLEDPESDIPVWGAFFGKAHHPAKDPKVLRKMALPLAGTVPVGLLADEVEPGDTLMFVDVELPASELHARGYPGVFRGVLKRLVDGETHSKDVAITYEEQHAGLDVTVGFGYDWRRDLAAETARLHQTVVEAARERASRGQPARVDIAAHSLGTLLVRYWLRYGPQPLPEDGSLPELTWEGARLAEQVLLVGPPNAGALEALKSLVQGGEVVSILPRYPAALVATFPSMWQLLPRVEHELVVYGDTKQPVDFFDVATWEALKWGPFNKNQDRYLKQMLPDKKTREERLSAMRTHVAACLAHAKQFQAALDCPVELPRYVQLHLFAGDAHGITSVIEINRKNGNMKKVSEEAGDGTVTRRSALWHGYSEGAAGTDRPPVVFSSVHFSSADHLGLAADPRLINDALYLLLEAPDLVAPPPDAL
jgi:hypothetical protein